ncbi:hypothetical protein KR059_004934, partial [Drosophila kikkawai]
EFLRDIFKVVRENTQRASLEQRKHYDLRRRAWRPTKYEGPYKVIKFFSPTIVRLQHIHSRQRRTASLGDLKEAVNEPETLNLVPGRLDHPE